MSALGEAVLKKLVEIRRPASLFRGTDGGEEGHAHYVRRQYTSSSRYFSKFAGFDVAGKRVLEIGCGTGGRSAYLAACGAARVVGIDINAAEIDVARRINAALFPHVRHRLEFLVSQEDGRLDIGEFDVVVSIDTMEHVVSPPRMMRLAWEYTRDGGQFCFSSIGYYHHAGAHLDLVPFGNLFFSDETLLNVVRHYVTRPDYVPGRFDSNPPVERWRGLYDLRDRPGEHLNKLTIHAIKKLVRYGPFRSSTLSVIGFGHKHPLLRVTDVLRTLPLLQEVYHSMVAVTCTK